jgi:hypothetical protein
MKQLLLAAFVVLGFVASVLAQSASISAPVVVNGVTPDIGATPGYCLYVDTGGHVSSQVCSASSSVNVPSGQSYLYNSLPIANAQTAQSNYFFGGAGNLTMTGSNNTAIGDYALYSNTTGSSNTASGYIALHSNTTGSNNTASGLGALYSNTTGSNNTASGLGALYSNTTGSSNTASGVNALYDYNDTTSAADNNSAFGYNTGRGLVTGVNNTILGANVTGLASALSNSIILATGDGTIRADFGKTTAGVWTFTGGITKTCTLLPTAITIVGGLVTAVTGGTCS